MVDDDGSWSVSCDAVALNAQGHLYVLEVATDDENFVSTVYRIKDIEAPDLEKLFEIERQITAMWMSPAEHLHLVDERGWHHTNDAGSWKKTNLRCANGLVGVWGFDDAAVYALGASGEVFRRTGKKWERFDEGFEDRTMNAINGRAPNDLYVVGEAGRCFHWDGQKWTSVPLDTKAQLTDVFVAGDDVVTICGERGTLFTGGPLRWRAVPAPAVDLHALGAHRGRLYVGAGDAGIFTLEHDAVSLAKDNVATYALAANDAYLATVGNAEVVRFDGEHWDCTELGC